MLLKSYRVLKIELKSWLSGSWKVKHRESDSGELLKKAMLHYLIDKEYVMYESGPEKFETSRALRSSQGKISELMDLVKKIM